MTALVGIDVGTTSVKTVAVSPDGTVLDRAESAYPLRSPRRGWAEQDPEDWWRATQDALDVLNVRPAAIGLSGQMHGLVALDRDREVLRPAILWNDQRTGAECDEIERVVGRGALVELTGNRALTGFTLPKLLWLRRQEPALYSRIAHVLLPKDYVRLRLTGSLATDVADASGTLLFDVGARAWSERMADMFDVDPSWLPPAHESTMVSGTTPDGVPVAAGAGDQAAGALGVGVAGPGALSVVLGTSGVVFAALEAFVADPAARVHAFCHAVPRTWQLMGVMLSAAAALAWVRDVVAPGGDYDALLGEAAARPAGCEGLLFAPYLSGERTPHADPAVRGAFVGLDRGHDRGALVRGVLEGVAYGLRDSLELLREVGVTTDVARVSGGGARSELWLQILATVLGLPLERTAVEEGAAFGAALLAGVAAGVFADPEEAIAACVRARERIEPVEAWRAVYDDGYARFRTVYPALRGVQA